MYAMSSRFVHMHVRTCTSTFSTNTHTPRKKRFQLLPARPHPAVFVRNGTPIDHETVSTLAPPPVVKKNSDSELDVSSLSSSVQNNEMYSFRLPHMDHVSFWRVVSHASMIRARVSNGSDTT
jgi:hypothetical protein